MEKTFLVTVSTDDSVEIIDAYNANNMGEAISVILKSNFQFDGFAVTIDVKET